MREDKIIQRTFCSYFDYKLTYITIIIGCGNYRYCLSYAIIGVIYLCNIFCDFRWLRLLWCGWIFLHHRQNQRANKVQSLSGQILVSIVRNINLYIFPNISICKKNVELSLLKNISIFFFWQRIWVNIFQFIMLP